MTKILIAESLDIDILKNFEEKEGVYLHIGKPVPASVSDSEIHFAYRPEFVEKNIEAEITDYDGLIVRPKEVSAKVMQMGKKLKIIVRGGSGLNAIDLEAAKKNNIIVENTPGENSISTAEYTFALIMRLVANRQIDISDSDVRNRDQKDPSCYQGQELAGKKIAIIGLGNIGMAVAKRTEAFDMEVSYLSRNVKNVKYKRYDCLENILASKPDVVSLHVPLTSETNKFFGKRQFSLMKKGTVLINCARPQLVCYQAFSDALREGVLSGSGIDGDMELIEPFVKADLNNKCVITNHIADSTKQAQEKITIAVLSQILAFFRNDKLINRV